MTDTIKPLTSAELADLKAKAKAATPGPWKSVYEDSGDFEIVGKDGYGVGVAWSKDAHFLGMGDETDQNENNGAFLEAANPETILRLIGMIERRDAVVLAAQEVVGDGLLSGAIESTVGRWPPYPVPPSSTTAKLIRLREALAATEPSDAKN